MSVFLVPRFLAKQVFSETRLAVIGAQSDPKDHPAQFRSDNRSGFPISGLPTTGLSVVHSITLADIDHDQIPEMIVLSGGNRGASQSGNEDLTHRPTSQPIASV